MRRDNDPLGLLKGACPCPHHEFCVTDEKTTGREKTKHNKRYATVGSATMFLRAKQVISAITKHVNAGALEIILIIERYEEELRLAKQQISRQQQLLAAVEQHTTPRGSIVTELKHGYH